MDRYTIHGIWNWLRHFEHFFPDEYKQKKERKSLQTGLKGPLVKHTHARICDIGLDHNYLVGHVYSKHRDILGRFISINRYFGRYDPGSPRSIKKK